MTFAEKIGWKSFSLWAGGGLSLLLSGIRMGQPKLDDRIRFSDQYYATVQTLCWIGIGIGAAMMILGFVVLSARTSNKSK